MLGDVFTFWISIISRCVNWVFTLQINDNPKITIGGFLLACATIGIAIKFILGTDLFPNFNFSNSNSSGNNQANNSGKE